MTTMKLTKSIKILTIATLALTATFAQADERLTCEEFGTIATDIMTARQNNANIMNVMKIYDDHQDAPKIKALVALSYQKKAYKTAIYQQREISDFANSMMLACYKVRAKQ